jgi:sporulation protein YlmC with PRC-barrel domain
MRIYHFLLPILGIAVVTVPVQAQTSQTAPPSLQTSEGGWITQLQPAQWWTSNLEGLDVYSSNNGDKIGEISDLIFDGSGKVLVVVLGVGRYLGIGERNIAVPLDQIRFVNEPRVNTTRKTTGEARLTGARPGGGTIASPAATGTAAVPAGSNSPAASNMAANNASAPVTPETRMGQAATIKSGSPPDHAVLLMSITKDELRTAPEFRSAR